MLIKICVDDQNVTVGTTLVSQGVLFFFEHQCIEHLFRYSLFYVCTRFFDMLDKLLHFKM